MQKKTTCTVTELDVAFSNAVNKAGPNPNALGFMRRIIGSEHFRMGPNGRADMPTQAEMVTAYHTCNLAARIGRW